MKTKRTVKTEAYPAFEEVYAGGCAAFMALAVAIYALMKYRGLKWMPIKDLIMHDPIYGFLQRPYNSRHSRKILEKMVPCLVAAIQVALHPKWRGDYKRWIVLDGQHTLQALLMLGFSHVPVIDSGALSESEMYKVVYFLNGGKHSDGCRAKMPWSPQESFANGVQAGLHHAEIFNVTTQKCGFDILLRKPAPDEVVLPWATDRVTALLRIYQMWGEKNGLFRTLMILKAAFKQPDEKPMPETLSRQIMIGIAIWQRRDKTEHIALAMLLRRNKVTPLDIIGEVDRRVLRAKKNLGSFGRTEMIPRILRDLSEGKWKPNA